MDLTGLGGEPDSQRVPGGTGFGGVTERGGIKPLIAGSAALFIAYRLSLTAAVNGVAHGGGMEVALVPLSNPGPTLL